MIFTRYSLQFEQALKNLTPNTERAMKKQNAFWTGFRKKEESYYFFRDPVILIEGDIGGYPIPQYRKKKWQIPKYRVENHLNTDTAYFNHIYNRLRILMVASI